MDGNWITLIMVAAAAVGVAAAVVTRKKKTDNNASDWRTQQIVVDVFDSAQAKSWFYENSRDCSADASLLVARLTPDMQKQLRIDSEVPDLEHHLILAVLENNSTKVYQIVNFDRLEESFCQMLDQCGGKMMLKK